MIFGMKASFSDTRMGNIAIDFDAIAQYAATVATECSGIVGMAGESVRDGLFKLLKWENRAQGIQINLKENKLTFRFHVIVAYGVDILATANHLMEQVRRSVEEHIGIEVERVDVFVEGVRTEAELG